MVSTMCMRTKSACLSLNRRGEPVGEHKSQLELERGMHWRAQVDNFSIAFLVLTRPWHGLVLLR